MTRPLIVKPEAEADIRAIYDNLEATRAGLGQRFQARLREVFGRIETMPEIYGVVWKRVRAAKPRKFPHIVYYVVRPDRVEVLAVIHGSRDPSVWQSRD